MFLPSRDQVASGASWVRCDVSFAALTAGLRPVWRRGSAEEVVLRRPEEVWACLDKFPQQPTRPQPFVPCDRPHKYEATGHGLVLLPRHLPLPAKTADRGSRVPVRSPRPRLQGADRAGALAAAQRGVRRLPARQLLGVPPGWAGPAAPEVMTVSRRG